MRSTTPFDAAEHITKPEKRYWFLLEALEPPISVTMLTGSVETVARAAGGVNALAREANVPSATVQDTIDATSIERAKAGIHALLDGLRQYVPESRQVA